MNIDNIYKTDKKEQETTINLDYYDKVISFYTCQKTVMTKIFNLLGIPNRIYYIKGLISGMKWKIPFSDKEKIRKILSKTIIIGSKN